jgi:hypothetical protein
LSFKAKPFVSYISEQTTMLPLFFVLLDPRDKFNIYTLYRPAVYCSCRGLESWFNVNVIPLDNIAGKILVSESPKGVD